jgi:5'-methylthioadenosine phosphorylase
MTARSGGGRTARLGVIGGSGLYRMEGLAHAEERRIETPFGAPSSPVLVGEIGATSVAFLARHGPSHTILPTEINFRANVWALKSLGVEFVLAVSAVGSLAEQIHPLDVVVPDQMFDRTRHRPDTFFGDGIVAHVSLADPVCADLAGRLGTAARGTGATVHEGGTYVCMEGPQFSTRAESRFYRSLGASVIGMTNMQEARLCREAELCFASMALVTDYDCWKTDEEPVSVEQIVDRLHVNAKRAQDAVRTLAADLPAARSCGCADALRFAIITPRAAWPETTVERLGPLLARHA